MAEQSYNTRQRFLIEQLIRNHSDKALTCDEISEMLKEEGTPVGKTTVYRCLEKLISSGRVRKLAEPDKKLTSFQFIDESMNCEKHLHMKCTVCGKMFHLGCEFMSNVSEHIDQEHSFKIDYGKTVIFGLCENCSGKV